jgi:hypothetical protein
MSTQAVSCVSIEFIPIGSMTVLSISPSLGVSGGSRQKTMHVHAVKA